MVSYHHRFLHKLVLSCLFHLNAEDRSLTFLRGIPRWIGDVVDLYQFIPYYHQMVEIVLELGAMLDPPIEPVDMVQQPQEGVLAPPPIKPPPAEDFVKDDDESIVLDED
ncbi:hypothetical protein L484_009702 [Morus notabilis]|uniref:Uncharacterized protein n=1 Tax=Morus notabilis TaxID=981085 RepID=W9S5U0_9ROSA|nr:hypothetical protein L484_009702 [Morus notabilis]